MGTDPAQTPFLPDCLKVHQRTTFRTADYNSACNVDGIRIAETSSDGEANNNDAKDSETNPSFNGNDYLSYLKTTLDAS